MKPTKMLLCRWICQHSSWPYGIVENKNREDSWNEIDLLLDAQAHQQCKETGAKAHIDLSHKTKICVGLLASACIRALGPDVRDCICSGEQEKSRQASCFESVNARIYGDTKQKNYGSMGSEISLVNMHAMLYVPEIKNLVRWFQRNSDLPALQTRSQPQLNQLGETSHQGDQ